MTPLSKTRTWILRGLYLLIFAGPALTIWPSLFVHRDTPPDANTAVSAIISGLSLLCAVGLRYPVHMLPVLLFEFLWKLVWLAAFGLPAWHSGHVDAYTHNALITVGAGVVLTAIAIPWAWLPTYFREFGNGGKS